MELQPIELGIAEVLGSASSKEGEDVSAFVVVALPCEGEVLEVCGGLEGAFCKCLKCGGTQPAG